MHETGRSGLVHWDDPIPQDHPSAPAPSALSHASNLDWRSISHMVIYMFHCHSPRSSYPRPLPQSPRDCSVHLCLFCCLALIFVLIHLFVVLGLHLLLTVLNISKRKKGRAEERKKEEFFSSFPSTFPSDTVTVGKNSFTNGGIF